MVLRLTLAIALGAAVLFGQPPVTTVVLVRHAEKAAEPADNPGLTAAGRARAKELARVLKDASVEAIVTSHFLRTNETAQPLAAQLGQAPEAIDDSAPVVQRVKTGLAGKTVLVVHHSNTLPQIIQALGGGAIEPIGDAEFDRMFVVTISAGGARVLKLRYGR
ncbi:MAG: histidine phosphatase family protein [Acidobacteria bacterium]|nr:histidine phosphatase family protein [Acidobacteriota bacterium]